MFDVPTISAQIDEIVREALAKIHATKDKAKEEIKAQAASAVTLEESDWMLFGALKVAALTGGTVPYWQAARIIDRPIGSYYLNHALNRIAKYCQQHELPVFTVLCVYDGTGLPAVGFDKQYARLYGITLPTDPVPREAALKNLMVFVWKAVHHLPYKK